MSKNEKPKDLCNLVVQVPRSLKLAFRGVCYKQSSTAKNAIILLMQAAVDGKVAFNKSLKIIKKAK